MGLTPLRGWALTTPTDTGAHGGGVPDGVGQSIGMLVTALLAPVLSAAFTTAAVAASVRARRFLASHVFACRAMVVWGLFAMAAITGWVPPAIVTASCAVLATVALWTAKPVRRRWGDPLPPGPKWDWEGFDAAFRAYVERLERRQRPRGHGDG